MKKLLHVGCGPKRAQAPGYGFGVDEWQEIRFDINPAVEPDLIGTMTDMSAVPSDSMDALYSSHNIEHLYPHEVAPAVEEFVRVLAPQGFAVITCPDLRSVCQLVVEDRLTEVAYESASGPIAAVDMLYGHRAPMAEGNLYMAHRCGFTLKVLLGILRGGGFATVGGFARPAMFDLWVVASKSELTEPALRELVNRHLPVR